MLHLPKVPQFPAKIAYDTIRDLFKAVANSECRSVLCTTGVVDYYSKFPFVKKLYNLTARAVVNEMKMLFAENGIPRSLQCDNGTQFTSGEFGFEIVMSSPHYNLEDDPTLHSDQRRHRSTIVVKSCWESCVHHFTTHLIQMFELLAILFGK